MKALASRFLVPGVSAGDHFIKLDLGVDWTLDAERGHLLIGVQLLLHVVVLVVETVGADVMTFVVDTQQVGVGCVQLRHGALTRVPAQIPVHGDRSLCSPSNMPEIITTVHVRLTKMVNYFFPILFRVRK